MTLGRDNVEHHGGYCSGSLGQVKARRLPVSVWAVLPLHDGLGQCLRLPLPLPNLSGALLLASLRKQRHLSTICCIYT